MNAVSDEEIELELPPLRREYMKNLGFFNRLIAKKFNGLIKFLLIILWVIIILSLVQLSSYKTLLIDYDIDDLIIKCEFYAVLPFLAFIIYYCIYAYLTYKNFGKNGYLELPSKFSANKNYLESYDLEKNFQVKYTWKYVTEVTENKAKDIIIVSNNITFQILPKEIFTNEEQRQQVFNQLTIWHSNAKTAFT